MLVCPFLSCPYCGFLALTVVELKFSLALPSKGKCINNPEVITDPLPPATITSPEIEVPDIEMVGVAVIASLKKAVMVTVSEATIRLSASVSESVTVGAVSSNVIVTVSEPP